MHKDSDLFCIARQILLALTCTAISLAYASLCHLFVYLDTLHLHLRVQRRSQEEKALASDSTPKKKCTKLSAL